MNLKKVSIAVDVLRIAGAVGFIAASASPAFAAATAADTAIFTKSCSMLTTVKNFLFGAVYVLGAIGLVLIAVSAFLGKFKFSHLISLGGGLFIVAMADILIDWLTSQASEDATTSNSGCSY